jgi:hypothetical protein
MPSPEVSTPKPTKYDAKLHDIIGYTCCIGILLYHLFFIILGSTAPEPDTHFRKIGQEKKNCK